MAIDPLAAPGLGTYWEDQNKTPADGVLDQTPGLTKDIPYHFLPGSDVGLDSAVNEAASEALFPTYDGVTNKLPPPSATANPDFATDFAKSPSALTADKFLNWHSAHQLEYIQSKGTTIPGTNPAQKAVVVGTSPNTMTAVASSDGLRVYVVENLQKRDFSIMPTKDQQAIAATAAFTTNGVGARLALTTSETLIMEGDGVDGSTTERGINDVISDIKTLFPDASTSVGLMSKDDRDVFLKEIQNIIDRVQNHMKVYSFTDIMKQVTEVSERFRRAIEFARTPGADGGPNNETTAFGDGKQYRNVVSLDGGETIKRGFQVFMEQEKRMLAIDNERLKIASTGLVKDKRLDAPNLVFLLQLQYNLTVEAKSTAETQEINQQNDLLKTYALMQQIINDTVKNFNHSDSKDDRALLGKNGADHLTSELTDQQAKVISMFEDALNGARHPIEILRKVSRPLEDAFNNDNKKLNEYLKPHWDAFATQLSDTVTLINQESQIKMNDINSLDKQKNRHFDLANGALQKMNEMIQNIARAGGS